MIHASASGVAIGDEQYTGLPEGALLLTAVAHIADSAIACVSANGRALHVLPSPTADAVTVEIETGKRAVALVPTATARVALGIATDDAASTDGRPVICQLCLVDCLSPTLEYFDVPALPSPVCALGRLSATSLLLLLQDGTLASWDATRPRSVERNAAPHVARAAWMWWNASKPHTSRNLEVLGGIGWVLAGSGDDSSAPQLCRFAIGANGDVVKRDPVPEWIAAALPSDHREFAKAPQCGGLVKFGNSEAVSFPCLDGQSGGDATSPASLYLDLSSDGQNINTSAATQSIRCVVTDGWTVAEEPCSICFDDFTFGDGESLSLDCGHQVHSECLAGCLARAEAYVPNGHRIVFNMCKCPQGCGTLVRHPCFSGATRIADRYAKIMGDVTERAKVDYPGHAADEVAGSYLHYVCGTCGEPFWGGSKDCAGMMAGEPDVDPKTLLCHKCARKSFEPCARHGDRWAFHKCSYCCNVASDFSMGHLWLCQACIDEKRKAPVWGDDGEPCVGPDVCPFGGHHPHSNASPLGCLLCFIDEERLVQSRLRQPASADDAAASS